VNNKQLNKLKTHDKEIKVNLHVLLISLSASMCAAVFYNGEDV